MLSQPYANELGWTGLNVWHLCWERGQGVTWGFFKPISDSFLKDKSGVDIIVDYSRDYTVVDDV